MGGRCASSSRGSSGGGQSEALPELVGSGKQVAWAEEIRAAYLNNLSEKSLDDRYYDGQRNDFINKEIARAERAKMVKETKAEKFIDDKRYNLDNWLSISEKVDVRKKASDKFDRMHPPEPFEGFAAARQRNRERRGK